MSLDARENPEREAATGDAVSAVRGSNQSGMRAFNERLVLSIVRQAGPMPKAAIARMTGLSAQTVSVIMRALERDGLLTKGEPVRGKVGQPSVPMGLAQDGAFFLGLKVGRRGSELSLVDFKGHMKSHTRKRLERSTPDAVVAFAHAAIAEILEQLHETQRARVAGLGIALPFRLWDWEDESGQHITALDAWRTHDIAADISSAWDFPVYLCNDASAACGAELVFGSRKKPRDFLYVYIGYFVGGGLVLDSALYTGKSGNAAALGSVPIVTASGDARQLVDVASLVTLERMLLDVGEDASAIWERKGSWAISQEVLGAWLAQAAQGLAQAIVTSTCLIDVETVLIDGSMPQDVRGELVQHVVSALGRLTVPGIAFPEIAEASIGYDAKTLGAASLPLADRFLVDRDALLKV